MKEIVTTYKNWKVKKEKKPEGATILLQAKVGLAAVLKFIARPAPPSAD